MSNSKGYIATIASSYGLTKQPQYGLGHKFNNEIRSGLCRYVVNRETGEVCGKPFTGGVRRKYCDQHKTNK